MPGENSGGGPDPIYSPIGAIGGGKVGRRVGGGRSNTPRRRKPIRRRSGSSSGIGAIGGGKIGQRVGQSKPKRRSSGGGGGGGGGGVGSSYLTSNGAGGLGVANQAPAPIPSLNDFLSGDDTYQSQVSALTKALANYRSQMGERTDEYNQDFSRRIKDLNLSEDRSTTDQADDYAGRGIYLSGLYGKARGDLERDFDNREGDMNLARTQFLAGLNRDFANYGEENNLSREKAKQDAINRRALQYGIM